jgi:zinc D-Ala-D-Ala dipeptidase
MKGNIIIFLAAGTLLLMVPPVGAQNKYGLTPMDYSAYRQQVKVDPAHELIDLSRFIPGIVLDIRYATTDNFTGEMVYTLARAYARKPVAVALKKIQSELRKSGLGIKIYDAYRPYAATVRFFELMKGDTTYVASPYKGSRHNRGCALDLTLIDIASGKELVMPTPYDAMETASWPSAPVNDPVIRGNRSKLIAVMESHGFKVYVTEWWHYDFVGWDKFAVMDINFEELEPKKK